MGNRLSFKLGACHPVLGLSFTFIPGQIRQFFHVGAQKPSFVIPFFFFLVGGLMMDTTKVSLTEAFILILCFSFSDKVRGLDRLFFVFRISFALA